MIPITSSVDLEHDNNQGNLLDKIMPLGDRRHLLYGPGTRNFNLKFDHDGKQTILSMSLG